MLSLRPMRSSWILHSKGPVYPTWSPGRQMLIRRHIRISPQYLLDDYNPRYVMLTPKQIECKIAEAETYLHNCTLCPHNCGVDRYVSTGYCALGAQRVPVSTISPHFGEESRITGMNGSGSIFFASCNLRCVFCQNYEISHVRDAGEMLTAEEIGEWMVKLQDIRGRAITILLPFQSMCPGQTTLTPLLVMSRCKFTSKFSYIHFLGAAIGSITYSVEYSTLRMHWNAARRGNPLVEEYNTSLSCAPT